MIGVHLRIGQGLRCVAMCELEKLVKDTRLGIVHGRSRREQKCNCSGGRWQSVCGGCTRHVGSGGGVGSDGERLLGDALRTKQR
jgi:hypothetical protein